MPRIITYSLRSGEANSDGYYRSIASFTNQWTPRALSIVKGTISDFHSYHKDTVGSVRSDAEYALEVLALGVLLQESHDFNSLYPPWVVQGLALLTQSQDHWPMLEATAKKLRGLLQGIFTYSEIPSKRKPPTHNSDIASLMHWLEAQSESGIVKRLSQWRDFLQAIDSEKRHRILRDCLVLAERFAHESEYALGKYTSGIQTFLAQTAPKHRWRYDYVFVSRARLEYHLGMLATEVLNRAYRQRFLDTQRKVVIVPPCMREQPDQDCKAIETPLGARCQACKPTCRVHHVTRMGEKHGFEVFIIPDELRGFGVETKRGKDSLGLVGVSCALTNWGGGWEANEMGVPAQGLLLDYVGCRYHWDEQGISTDTNLAKLKEIVGITDASGG